MDRFRPLSGYHGCSLNQNNILNAVLFVLR
jgi:hypothetical protein